MQIRNSDIGSGHVCKLLRVQGVFFYSVEASIYAVHPIELFTFRLISIIIAPGDN